MMSVPCVAFFWVVNASSHEKICLQFSIPTESGAGREEGVSHALKVEKAEDEEREKKEITTSEINKRKK